MNKMTWIQIKKNSITWSIVQICLTCGLDRHCLAAIGKFLRLGHSLLYFKKKSNDMNKR